MNAPAPAIEPTLVDVAVDHLASIAYSDACDRLAAGTATRADVQTVAEHMRARGFEKVQLKIYRFTPPRKRGTVKLLGRRGGPPSRIDSKVTVAGDHLIAAWWDLDQLDYWLARHPEGDHG